MAGSTVVIGWGLGVALLLLVVVGAVAATVGRLGVGRDVVTAAARAALQPAAVSAVIIAVVRSLLLSAALVVLRRTRSARSGR